ncbi:hypothetical protein [Paracraurococcus lichenis]|uniref:Uncharacterized protein n=1 Tax=Paracraurococcus lichenis TaxID=3064888 RepID=A0ABT9EA05_9PROT|nr:hypothetical protein [Paracraurococcus sp. LOR1-02]MDO9712962.1 hypothetical protein [Paracraurococcus sp. LOR1-02]
MRETLAQFDQGSNGLAAVLGELEVKVTAGNGRDTAADMQATLGDILFIQVQERDLIQQMMEAVFQAPSLLPDGVEAIRLAQLYVSDTRHAVHRAALPVAPERGDAR